MKILIYLKLKRAHICSYICYGMQTFFLSPHNTPTSKAHVSVSVSRHKSATQLESDQEDL